MNFRFLQTKVDDMKATILRMVSAAQSQIILAMYMLTDPDLLFLLATKAARGVRVYIIVDETSPVPLTPIIRNGGFVRVDHSSGLFHCKYCLIDRRDFIGGSYNWTTAASKTNREDLVVVTDVEPAQVNAICSDYSALWLRATPVDLQAAYVTPGPIPEPPAGPPKPDPPPVPPADSPVPAAPPVVDAKLDPLGNVWVASGPAVSIVQHAHVTIRR